MLNFLRFAHPVPSPRIPRFTRCNCKYCEHVHQVCASSYVVWYIDECSITVIMQTNSYWALTPLSINRMTSLTEHLLVYCVTCKIVTVSLNNNRQTEVEQVGYYTTWFRFCYLHIVRSTFTHAQMTYHGSQSGHWTQKQAVMLLHIYPNCCSLKYDRKN
jgi:hypothetical protein